MNHSKNGAPREMTAEEEEGYPPSNSKEDGEDLTSSEPMLWYPFSVVKEDRKKATVVWVTLLAAFLAYVAYIIADTFRLRSNPASSIEIKQEHFKFPDMAFCVDYLHGCLTFPAYCFNETFHVPWAAYYYHGFLGDPGDFAPTEASLTLSQEYPGCSVIPLSSLEVNETGIKNGDITYFGASFFFLWIEDISDTYDANESGHNINTQFVSVYFIDLDNSVKSIGEEIVDAMLPYERVELTYGGDFALKQNHMVLSMTEFAGIEPSSGKKQKAQRTYSQSTTTGTQNWRWTDDGYSDILFSFLSVDITIGKFEYTRIEEIDPVDGWAIIGAIGGVWQFVVLGFGIFFVYADKQRTEMKKFRNIKKTVSKSASIITRKLSSVSSKLSRQQSVEGTHPDDSSVWQGAYKGTVNNDSQAADRLPPGWVMRINDEGQTFYVNTILKTTQWERPTQCAPSNRRVNVQAFDTPAMQSREKFSVPRSYPHESKQEEKVRVTVNSAHAPRLSGTPSCALPEVDAHLPPDWEERVTPDGKIYYANHITKATQWVPP